MPIYLISIYDEQIPDNILKSGTYGENRCGGGCEWYISEYLPTTNIVFCVPYKGEKYCYVISFYHNNLEKSILFSKINSHSGSIYKGNNVPEYVLLTDSLLTEIQEEYEDGELYYFSL